MRALASTAHRTDDVFRAVLGFDGAESLAEALKVNSRLTTLQLEGNGIDSDGAIAIADALKVNTSLTDVNLKVPLFPLAFFVQRPRSYVTHARNRKTGWVIREWTPFPRPSWSTARSTAWVRSHHPSAQLTYLTRE